MTNLFTNLLQKVVISLKLTKLTEQIFDESLKSLKSLMQIFVGKASCESTVMYRVKSRIPSCYLRSASVIALICFLGVGNVWGTSVTYTFSNKNWNASPANWSGTAADAYESSSPARGVQIYSGSGSLTITSPVSYSGGVSSVTIVASSNKSNGSIAVNIGTTEIAEKTIQNSTNATYTYNFADYPEIASLSGNVQLIINRSSNGSVYVKSVTITYSTEKYTVTYNAGSGTCATSSEKESAPGVGLILPDATPTALCASEGWVFAGWKQSSPLGETTSVPALYLAGSRYNPEADETLYAVYRLGEYFAIDFESAASAYSDWTFTNVRPQQYTIIAHDGRYYGNNTNDAGNALTTCTIQTKNKITAPLVFRCYITRESGNNTESTWNVETSEDGSSWTARGSLSAIGMGQGTWQEFSVDLSSYSNVYVRLRYGSTNAIRAVDDVVISGATFHSTPNCIYDYYVDIMHGNETTRYQSTYSTPAAPSDASKGEDTHCDEKHYHFIGWVEESDINENGTLKAGATLYPAGDAGHTAANKTFYAIWAKEE